ncbi:lipocalin family protein [Bordetella bronchiseptica]|uniref:lipocalin family protein n=1 Tax=Bordetella bronchiseptica TaxID=518 RepID=UPI0004A056DB|nr:lipocalin family protein [Bordetella bronchiseptica]KDD85689.1 lipocalin-like protein [Bordetella bronchiseptica MO275]
MFRLAFLFAAAALATGAVAAGPAVRTVESVDLARYAGKWYEIAHLPMFLQRQCVGDTTAEYTQNADGSLAVNNRCRTKDGSIDAASGTATVVEGSGNAKLEVSFFKPFKGAYWIIGLDPDYRWAVVGSPDRDNLWILSRRTQLAPADLQNALAVARAQGYALDELRYTPQQR